MSRVVLAHEQEIVGSNSRGNILMPENDFPNFVSYRL